MPNRSLTDIIVEAVPFVCDQLKDQYDKYIIEREMRWEWQHPVVKKIADNVMSKIIENWAISDEKIILINCTHHDIATTAYEFESVEKLEYALKTSRFYINMFCTYVIPVVYGKVKPFALFDEKGNQILKEPHHDLPPKNTMKTLCLNG